MPLDIPQLIAWFQDRPLWICAAASRLLAKQNLSAEDIDYLKNLCFQEANPPSELRESPDLSALLVAHKSSTVPLRLSAISEINGIEGLNPKTPLTFSADPLTIVYGGTGSGKSSYVRILNNICGSKNRRQLLGDVFKETGPLSCKVSFSVGGVSKDISWQPSDGLHADLTRLEIYDSECGSVYVNADNEVTFEPYLLGLFQRLVEVCGQVDNILDASINALPSQAPTIPPEFATTPAATWYQNLSAKTPNSQVLEWCSWSPTLDGDLIALHTRALERKPAERARQLRRHAAALENLRTELRNIHDRLAPEVVASLLNSKRDAVAKRKAASADAEKIFRGAPLSGVGEKREGKRGQSVNLGILGKGRSKKEKLRSFLSQRGKKGVLL